MSNVSNVSNVSNEIEDLFKDANYCRSQILEARQLFGDKTTSEKQYDAMERALAFGLLYCPDEMIAPLHSTLLEATKRRTHFMLYFWKSE